MNMMPEGGFLSELIRFEGDSALIQPNTNYLAGQILNCQCCLGVMNNVNFICIDNIRDVNSLSFIL